MMCIIASILLLGASLSTAASIPGYLDILESTDTKLEGIYAVSQGRGIYFTVSGKVDNSMKHLHIASLSGSNIIRMQDLDGKRALVSLRESTFLRIPGTEGSESKLYDVPRTHMEMAQVAMIADSDVHVNLLRDGLQEISDEEGMAYLMNLLRQEEDINLIHDAALAVAQASEQRVLTPATRSFYMTGIGLKNAVVKHASRLDLLYSQAFQGQEGPRVCRKAITIGLTSLTASSGFSVCTGNGCVRSYTAPGYFNECYGMCGPECMCWQSLCGDCCVHRFCETHDNCCSKSGAWAQLRCWAPISTSDCSEEFGC